MTSPVTNAAKTECKHGHPFTPENTYYKPSGARQCNECRRTKVKEWMRRKRADSRPVDWEPYTKQKSPRPERVKEFCIRGHKMSETASIQIRRGRPVQVCRECAKINRATCQESQPRLVKKYTIKHQYGLTLEEFDHMMEAQDGRCAICGEQSKLNIDHSHQTGEIRALLCRACNFGLGNFKDNIKILEQAIKYVKDLGV